MADSGNSTTNESEQAVKGQLIGTLEGKTFSIPVSLAVGESKIVRVTSKKLMYYI